MKSSPSPPLLAHSAAHEMIVESAADCMVENKRGPVHQDNEYESHCSVCPSALSVIDVLTLKSSTEWFNVPLFDRLDISFLDRLDVTLLNRLDVSFHNRLRFSLLDRFDVSFDYRLRFSLLDRLDVSLD